MEEQQYVGIAQGKADSLTPIQELLTEAQIPSQAVMPQGVNPNS